MGQVEKCPSPYATILSNDPIMDSSSNCARSQAENVVSSDNMALSNPFEMVLPVISRHRLKQPNKQKISQTISLL